MPTAKCVCIPRVSSDLSDRRVFRTRVVDLLLSHIRISNVSVLTMLFFTLIIVALITLTYAQSPASTALSDDGPNTCLRRSVLVYTQDSSTYVVTNIGSTSFAATPTFCSNATVTVCPEPTSIHSSPPLVADAGFENGQNNPSTHLLPHLKSPPRLRREARYHLIVEIVTCMYWLAYEDSLN